MGVMMQKMLTMWLAGSLALAGCSDTESVDALVAEGGGHPVCKSAKSTLNYQAEWMKAVMAKRDSGQWTQEKMMMVMERMNEYAHKIDPKVREYASFCDDLDRIRDHYAF